ncbi:hypothetical protein BEWA_030960 [Theileria equi strain WA]|uniref:Inhibitor of growth protein N-terminal histone-binding domain-containing protein n=1 Tax=Theileria equi strain WA TaxID=1537102 RepID=L0AYA7_THEEQ|nr:hypothetical protein BEWA_030960 [Theileria equi strain WA]AFZ80243.1 hypothetical protein BEWA_030960 [Theileria equi strain WA]|eukprot:XP_004829909.1 hypothetical protein BEWA_030960 [Theileria equi strain WA]
MENLEDITDELLGLPGYVRRNLLLMRDLDLKSVALFNEANQRSQTLLINDNDAKQGTPGDRSSVSPSPINSKKDDGDKRQSSATSKVHKIKSDPDTKSSSDHASLRRRASRDPSISDFCDSGAVSEYDRDIDEIQTLRMQGIYALQEKLDVNNQITCMLKHEYENLRSKFDSMYSEMEVKGLIPAELKMNIALNKNKYYPGNPLQPSTDDGGTIKRVGEHSTLPPNQLDIATMFRNVAAQEHWKSESKNLENSSAGDISRDNYDFKQDRPPLNTYGSQQYGRMPSLT